MEDEQPPVLASHIVETFDSPLSPDMDMDQPAIPGLDCVNPTPVKQSTTKKAKVDQCSSTAPSKTQKEAETLRSSEKESGWQNAGKNVKEEKMAEIPQEKELTQRDTEDRNASGKTKSKTSETSRRWVFSYHRISVIQLSGIKIFDFSRLVYFLQDLAFSSL